jgi:transposase
MWAPYITAIIEILPSSHIVYDKYHIIANLNKRIDELRRKEYSLNSKLDRSIIKGTRFLLLKHPDKLNESARDKLKKLFRVNKSLATCYQMKEMLYQLWCCQGSDDARTFLISWCKMAQETAIQPLIKFANLMLAHRTAVLNYFKYPFTNARVEGLNNKIKTLKRQAYGFRNMANFFLKIFSIHKSRYALIG